jgi:hypothetical protein
VYFVVDNQDNPMATELLAEPAETSTEGPQNIDEEMAQDWATIREKFTDEPIETQKVDKPAAKETPKTEEPARDEMGKFVAKQKDEKPTPAAAKPASDVPAKADTSAAIQEPVTRDTNRAPSTWKPAARAEWDKLTPAIRAEVHRREMDFQNGQAQLLPDARLGASMRQVIEPYRAQIEAEGGTPERAVADLLRTAAVLRQGTPHQKLAAVVDVARTFGVPLEQLTSQQPNPAPNGQAQDFRDPRVDQILAHQRQQEINRQRSQQMETEGVVTKWMNETDANGNPKHPYLGDVINEVSALIPQLRQNDPTLSHAQALDAAYERAIWGNPEIRTLLQQEQQTALEEQRRAENQQRVNEARKAASVNVRRRASTPSPAKPGKIEDTIAETARALGMIS